MKKESIDITDIILINPPFKTQFITPPLGIGYLASFLKKAGFKTLVLDCNASKKSFSDIQKIIKETRPLAVGVTACTNFINAALKVLLIAKMTDLSIKTIIGGPHASALPDHILKKRYVDFVIKGEGELTIVELMRNLYKENAYSNIKGLCFKKGHDIMINPDRPLIKNLDELPFPDWDSIPPNKYPRAPHGLIVNSFPVAPIITSRGCFYNCSYCATNSIWKQRLRNRSIDNVLDEIEFLIHKFGVKEFQLEDDNFTFDPNRVIEFCKKKKERKLDFEWSCPNGVRIDSINKDLLKLMKNAGCNYIIYGIESANYKILNRVNKKIPLLGVKNLIEYQNKNGITSAAFFMFGLPGETKRSISNTINYSLKVPFQRAHFEIFTPLPGSREFKVWIKDEKVDIDSIKWKDFNFYTSIINSCVVKGKDIKKYQKIAFLRFYLRFKIIINIIRKVKIANLPSIFKRIISIFIKN
ncbi:MAG: B12-binding domain-containing radical SAM protein [Promethearchaeota archaeon]